MGKLRTLTERDLLAEAMETLGRGEVVDWKSLALLQTLNIASAGRASLVDALEREDEADADLERILGN